MKPDEIKKVLECCIKDDCDNCPDTFGNCEHNAMANALVYINKLETESNHQHAKIEALKMDNEQLQSDIVNANGNCDKLQNDCELLKTALAQKIVSEIKSEVIKEFGKYLIDKSENGVISICDIPTYVAEMVGENNDLK